MLTATLSPGSGSGQFKKQNKKKGKKTSSETSEPIFTHKYMMIPVLGGSGTRSSCPAADSGCA